MIPKEEAEGLLAEADYAKETGANGGFVLLTPEYTRQIVGKMTNRKEIIPKKLVGPFNFPRRASIPHLHPAELAIRDAVAAVEQAGAHTMLTDAVILLQQAMDKVADYIDTDGAKVKDVLCPDCSARLRIQANQPLPDTLEIHFVEHAK